MQNPMSDNTDTDPEDDPNSIGPGPAGNEDQYVPMELDENRNLVPATKKKPFKQKVSSIGPHLRNFQVLNIFTEEWWRRFLGIKPRKKAVVKKVHFPSEVIRKAEEKGETSPGDMDNLPKAQFPYKPIYSQQKSRVIRVSRGKEFKPQIAWIEDTNPCELFCERMITSCNCMGGVYQDPRMILTEKVLTRKQKKNKTPKLTKLTESFMYHVNIAEFFIIGHKTRTLITALENVDGPSPFHRFTQEDAEIVTDWPTEIRVTSADNEEEKVIYLPERESMGTALQTASGEEIYYLDELPPLSTAKFGRLAECVWVFAACIPLLFSDPEDLPSETRYRKLMSDFAALAMSANEAAYELLVQSKDFYNYASEAMRVIRNVQLKILLEGDTHVNPPLKMGSGLQFVQHSDKDRPGYKIMIATRPNPADGASDDWNFKPFEDLPTSRKITALKNLILQTQVELEHSKHQIDFLVDDVKETTYDMRNDIDLLYRLSEMYHCIDAIYKRTGFERLASFSQQHHNPEPVSAALPSPHPQSSSSILGESGSQVSSAQSVSPPLEPGHSHGHANANNNNSTEEVRAVCETMSKFHMSLCSFFSASQHIMEKIMEANDMVNLSYHYLQEEVKIDMSKLIPPDTPRLVLSMGLHRKNLKGRKFLTSLFCGGTAASVSVSFHEIRARRKEHLVKMPRYNGKDFHRVHYEELIDGPEISTDGFKFKVVPTDFKISPSLHNKVQPPISFRASAPPVLGGLSASNRAKEEDEDDDDNENEDPTLSPLPTLENIMQPTLKPILKDSGRDTNSPPKGSLEPDASAGQRISDVVIPTPPPTLSTQQTSLQLPVTSPLEKEESEESMPELSEELKLELRAKDSVQIHKLKEMMEKKKENGKDKK